MALITNLETAAEAVKAMGYPKDSQVLRFVLSRTWPFPDGEDPFDMSGLDCLLVVMRHILAQSSEIDAGLSPGLTRDPLVSLCLRDFSGETPEKLADMQKERVHMFEEIQAAAGESVVPFRRIAPATALWRELSCDPYQPVLHKKSGSGQWVLSDSDDYYKPPSIRFRTTEHKSIQAAIDSSVGVIHEDREKEEKSALYGAAPCFLSVLYFPDDEKNPGFGIDSVAEVELPRHRPNSVEGGVVFEEVGKSRYRLIAVVRRRPRDRDEHDLVRIYDVNGKNILPLGDKSRYAGIVDDSWSLADQDRSCMLFYVRLDRPAPEGGPPRMEEVHHEDLEASEARETAAAVPQENPGGDQPRGVQTEPKTPSKLAPPPVAPPT